MHRKAPTPTPSAPSTPSTSFIAPRLRKSARPGPRAGVRPAPGPAKAPTGTRSHEVRIIGGQWKRSKLPVLDRPGLRPTPDRVRETLFNWLGQTLAGWRCVDAFAGTGALGFEAASRGAQAVLLVERDAALVAQLHKTQAQLAASTVRVQQGDGWAALAQQAAGSCELVLLDPPFDQPLTPADLQCAARALVPGGWLYVEAPKALSAQDWEAAGLLPYRYLKAGAVHAHLVQRVVNQGV